MIYKTKINNWIDFHLSNVVGRCGFCRGYNFGIIEGIAIAYLILEIKKPYLNKEGFFDDPYHEINFSSTKNNQK